MEIIGLIKKAEKAEKDKVYSELMDTSKTEVTSLAMDKTIDNSAPFNFDDIYTRPFFINNFHLIYQSLVLMMEILLIKKLINQLYQK